MIGQLKKIIQNPLFFGSALMILGSNATNFINYIYHLGMGRLLGPADYGELTALLSLVGLLGMLPSSLGLVIVKYISASESAQVLRLVNWFHQKMLIMALIIALLTLVSTPWIASFMHVSNPIFLIGLGASFLFTLPSLLYKSTLQGLLHFKQMIISTLSETTIKLILGVILVYLGFSVGGALTAFIMAGVSGLILSRYFLKKYLKDAAVVTDVLDLDARPIISYILPVLIQSVAITSLYSTDLVLVKHFFPSYQTGLYAAFSTLGKIIFFGAGPISAVMFPMISKRQATGKRYKTVFLYSFFLTFGLSLGILAIYWLFPDLVIKALYGPLYLQNSYLLIWFGAFATLFTLSSILISFHLSLGQTTVVALPFLAAILQFTGIWLYHDSIKTVITVSFGTVVLLFIGLLLYYGYHVAKSKER